MSFLNELKKQKVKLKETTTVVTHVDGQRYMETNSSLVSIPSNAYGFVVDTKPDNVPVLIVEHLYIGSQDCAVNSVIDAFEIKHVLSLGISVDVLVDNKFVNCLDLPETNITDVLESSLPYIRAGVECKENVLVHCNAGVSRTAMVAIAYLMHYHKMEFEDAYKLVKRLRPSVQPNDGFRKQLKAMKPGDIIKDS